MKKPLRGILLLLGVLASVAAQAYPIDGADATGIERLRGYQLRIEKPVRGVKQPLPGARLGLDQVQIDPLGMPRSLDSVPRDEALAKAVLQMLGAQKNRFSVAVLDVTDPDAPAYAEHRPDVSFNPGSVGKVAVAVAVFKALHAMYPDDIEARKRVLTQTRVAATPLIYGDKHDIPFWDVGKQRMTFRQPRVGDEGNLYTWLDWMLSASSNAAASTLIREAMLMRYFGREYPVSKERADDFFRDTPLADRSALLRQTLDDGLIESGLDIEGFRQGNFFTGKHLGLAAGSRSYGTVKSLMELLLALQQGRLVDAWSSLEIKRLLYMTQKRIRYASAPALNDSALYFKSGSLYGCQNRSVECPEYKGDRINLLNSVVMVESPQERGPTLRYMVVVSSNILRQNSSVAHQTLGMRIQRYMQKRHPADGALDQ